MREAFLDFTWPVNPAYHWQDWLDEQGERVLVPADELHNLDSPAAVNLLVGKVEQTKELTGPVLGPVGAAGTPRQYHPMQRKHAALFLTFAALDFRDKKAIREFASTYGLLGAERQEQGPLHKHRRHYAFGESHLTWAYEICAMREGIGLVRPRSAQEEADEDAGYKKNELDPEYYRRALKRKQERLFNRHLQHVQSRIAFEKGRPPRLSFEPRTLLAAMWLQLALATAQDKRFPACKFCQRLFEISTAPTGFRTHREFCSASCKTQDYRRRKRMALRLAGQGMSVRAIAEQTKTSAVTTRTWVQAGKERRKAAKGSA